MDDSDIDEMQKVERSENDDEFWQLVDYDRYNLHLLLQIYI